ncbi:T9SS type A sorting domain-containing protein [candidate division KSB1 bacterium]|nr:T9SS type A sorting domain-containing protein [candidate division KSB1 bacterium]
MRKIIMTMIGCLLLTGALNGQDIVQNVRQKFTLNRVQALNITMSDVIISSYSFRDANGDGTNDFMMLRDDAQGNPNQLVVMDGATREPFIIIITPLAFFGTETFTYTFIGWFDVDADGNREAIFYDRDAKVVLGAESVAESFLEDIFLKLHNVELITVADVDNDGFVDVLVANRSERSLHGYGTVSGLGKTADMSVFLENDPAVRLSTTESPLTLKYQSPKNFRPAFAKRMIRRLQQLDGDGNGVPDVVLMREADAGNPQQFISWDFANQAASWNIQSADHEDEIDLYNFNGFFDITVTDVDTRGRAALFGNNLVVMPDTGLAKAAAGLSAAAYSAFRVSETFKMMFAADLDSDGAVELIGMDMADSTVQAWGAPNTATSVSAADVERALGIELEQNYPNPFNPETAISYHISAVSDVKLTIFNVQGQAIRTLVQGQQAAGSYQVPWDGLNDAGLRVASGPYLYCLQVGNQTMTKQMMLLK